ncbi:hypothetical protein T09_6274 [Trichinella sp. T9]|nr:hypothetical protein T09_6274 [Trichinella sp. T9]
MFFTKLLIPHVISNEKLHNKLTAVDKQKTEFNYGTIYRYGLFKQSVKSSDKSEIILALVMITNTSENNENWNTSQYLKISNESTGIFNITPSPESKRDDSDNGDIGRMVHNWIYVFSGIFAIITNGILLVLVLKKKKILPKDKFISGYAVGSAILGIGYLYDHSRQIVPGAEWPGNMTAVNCMLASFNITLFMTGDLLVVLCIFYMSIDGILAISSAQTNLLKKQKLSNYFGYIAILLAGTDVGIAWISAAMKPRILPICYHRAMVSNFSFLFHYWSLVILGYVSTFIYTVAIIILKKKKTSSSGIREIQIRRELEVMKQVIIIIINSFALETVPVSLELLCEFSRHAPTISIYIWLFQAINLSLFAVARIVKDSQMSWKRRGDRTEILEKGAITTKAVPHSSARFGNSLQKNK